MPDDPLFRETSLSPALRAELGIPAGTELQFIRLTGEGLRYPTLAATADGSARRLRRGKVRIDPRYEAVVVYSLDAEGGGWPWWGPGRWWLTRIRFGDDPVYGEVRPPRPDDPHGQLRRFAAEEGEPQQVDWAARQRAWRGVDLLAGERVGGDERPLDSLVFPEQGAADKEQMIRGMVNEFRKRTPYREISQSVAAAASRMSRSTYQRRLIQHGLHHEALKAEAWRRYLASGPPPPSPDASPASILSPRPHI